MKLRLMLLMVILLFGVASAVPIAACGVLAAGTSYTLTANINLTVGASCFSTGGANIIFDGQGYTVDTGGWGGDATAFTISHAGVTVKNVRLDDWMYGFNTLQDTQSYQNITANNMSAAAIRIDPSAAITSFYINDILVTNSKIGICSSCYLAGAPSYDIGLVIANATINTNLYALMLNRTNATVTTLTTNSSIVQDYSKTNSTYTGLTMTDFGGMGVVANKLSDAVITDLAGTSAIFIKAYDSSSGIRINATNTTVYSATTNVSNNRFWFMLDYRSYNMTTATAKIEENAGYYPAWLDLSQGYLSGFGYAILLLPKTAPDVSLINFHVQDTMKNPIANATCSVFKSYSGNWWLMSAKKSETTGVVAHYMQTSVQYKIICTASGYSTLTTYITPTSTDYEIGLSSTTGGIGYPTDVEGVRTTFNSTGPLQWNAAQTLTFTIYNTSVNSSLDFFAWVVKNHTTVLDTQNDSISPGGGSLTYTFTPGNNSNITVRIIFLRTDRSVVDYTFRIPTYLAYPSSPASLSAALASFGSFGSFTVIIITLIVGAAVGGWVSGISAGAGIAAFLGILTLGFLTVNPILSGLILLASFMVAAGYFMLRGGGE